MKSLKNTLRAIGTAGLVALASACSKEPTQPNRAEISKSLNLVSIDGRECAEDVDNDGSVDYITMHDSPYFVTAFKPGYEVKAKEFGKDIVNYSKPMSPERLDAASRLLKAKQDYRFAEAQEKYDAFTNETVKIMNKQWMQVEVKK